MVKNNNWDKNNYKNNCKNSKNIKSFIFYNNKIKKNK